MIGTLADDALKTRFEFHVGLRFEFFYALRLLADDNSRIHAEWKTRAGLSVPADYYAHLQGTGRASEVWTLCADSVSDQRVDLTFREIVDDLRAQPESEFQRRFLLGAIHFPDIVDRLVAGRISLKDAIAKAPQEKRDWFAWIGLFPCDSDAPLVQSLEKLLADPGRFRYSLIGVMEAFWEGEFKSLWASAQQQLSDSLAEKERLFESCTLDEFAQRALLRIDVNYERNTIAALRGGAETHFDDIRRGYIIPSMFNDRRYWTVHADDPGVVYMPYFDPGLSPDLDAADAQPMLEEIEPILLFKALGDSTRFAIARRIARQPLSATELAAELGVSKPTISHHLTVLREAGLLNEVYSQGYNSLRLRRDVIEQLSRVGLLHLFGDR